MVSNVRKGIRIGLLSMTLGCALPVLAASESDEYLAEAKKYLAEGEGKSAIIQLKNSLKSDPSNADARLLLGELYLRSGNAEGAAKELGRAARLGAPKDQWMVGLGQALLMQNDFDEVLNEINPDEGMSAAKHATALAIRGNAYMALNDVENAQLAYEKALTVQNSNPLARLGNARLLLKDNKRDEAAEQFTEVLSEYPEHVETRLARGELYRSLNKLPEAVEDFSVAVEKAPHDSRGYMGRALASIGMQDLELAEKDVKELKKRAGKLPVVNYLSGLLEFQRKDYDASAESLQLALRNAPENLQAQMLYGIVSYARGQYTIAEDYLGRVSSRIPRNPQLSKLLAASRLKLKDHRGAIEVLEPLVEATDSKDVQALALLGTAYLQAGENEKGTEAMAKAVELDPEQALLRTQLAAGRIALGDAEGAISHLESAVTLGQDIIQADVLLVLGYLQQKQYDEAIEAAEDLEKRMPESPIPPNLTGLAYMAQNKYEQADAKFQESLSVDPSFVVANMNLARMSLLQNKPEQAKTYYGKALKQSPGNQGALLGLAVLASSAGNEAEAEDYLQQAYDANPGSLRPTLLLAELLLKKKEPLKAARLLTGLTEEQAKTPAALRLQGMSQLQSGDFSSAKLTFERLVDLQPNSVESWFQLARAQAATGDHARSRESFDRAIALDEQHQLPLIWIGKGELELRDKRYQEALDLSLEMQKHFPGNAMAYEIEAAAYRGMGKVQQAIRAVEKAVRAEGSSQRINLFAHTLAASGDTPKAVYMLEDWLEKNQDDGVSWSTLGMMYQQMGNNDKALPAYEKAVDLTGGNPVVLNNMAWLYLDSDIRKAADLSRQAYEIAPERAEIVDTYGWVLFKQGKHKEALNVLQQALVIAPRNPEIGLHVAQALHQLGRNKEAKPLLERIVNDHPHTPFSKPARDLLKKLGG